MKVDSVLIFLRREQQWNRDYIGKKLSVPIPVENGDNNFELNTKLSFWRKKNSKYLKCSSNSFILFKCTYLSIHFMSLQSAQILQTINCTNLRKEKSIDILSQRAYASIYFLKIFFFSLSYSFNPFFLRQIRMKLSLINVSSRFISLERLYRNIG